MNKKISFLKNPRFKVNKVPIPMNTVSPPYTKQELTFYSKNTGKLLRK